MAIDRDRMSESDYSHAISHLSPILGQQRIVYAESEKPKRKQQGRGENQLELAFYAHLDTKPVYYWRKPIILRIGPDMTFEPDAVVWDDGSDDTFVIDTKGPHSWEDSRIKIKIAAEKYPMWRWLIVTRPDGVWRAKEVTAAKGISRKFIDLPWLD